MIRRPPRSTRTDHTLSLHDALPILSKYAVAPGPSGSSRVASISGSDGHARPCGTRPSARHSAIVFHWLWRSNTRGQRGATEIGRASCRERVCQYVEISVGAGSLKKKKRREIIKRK